MKNTGRNITLSGISGKQYIFDLYSFENFDELNGVFASRPALYLFTRRSAAEDGFMHDLIYLGETGNLSDRFNNHHKKDEIMSHHANCIGIHGFVGSDESRKALEKDILSAYDFPCNEQLNS